MSKKLVSINFLQLSSPLAAGATAGHRAPWRVGGFGNKVSVFYTRYTGAGPGACGNCGCVRARGPGGAGGGSVCVYVNHCMHMSHVYAHVHVHVHVCEWGGVCTGGCLGGGARAAGRGAARWFFYSKANTRKQT